jgi:hypothetical protein
VVPQQLRLLLLLGWRERRQAVEVVTCARWWRPCVCVCGVCVVVVVVCSWCCVPQLVGACQQGSTSASTGAASQGEGGGPLVAHRTRPPTHPPTPWM